MPIKKLFARIAHEWPDIIILFNLVEGRFGRSALLSRNFSEQRKLRIHNGVRHLGYEIIVENFI